MGCVWAGLRLSGKAPRRSLFVALAKKEDCEAPHWEIASYWRITLCERDIARLRLRFVVHLISEPPVHLLKGWATCARSLGSHVSCLRQNQVMCSYDGRLPISAADLLCQVCFWFGVPGVTGNTERQFLTETGEAEPSGLLQGSGFRADQEFVWERRSSPLGPLGLRSLPPGCSRKGWRRRSPWTRTNELTVTGQSWWASGLPSYHSHRIWLKAKPCYSCISHKSGDKDVHAGSSAHLLRLITAIKAEGWGPNC